jgi:hypothetical protein
MQRLKVNTPFISAVTGVNQHSAQSPMRDVPPTSRIRRYLLLQAPCADRRDRRVLKGAAAKKRGAETTWAMMATRDHRLAMFNDAPPPTNEPLKLLCEDNNGTYLLPFPV